MSFANRVRRACLVAGLFTIGTAEFLIASPSTAQPDGSRPVLGPPPEMVEACNGAAAGDDCTVALKDHTMNGTCRAGPTADAPLACVPKGARVLVTVAVDACKDRAAGDSCAITFGDRTVDGTCGSDPYRDGHLICRPANRKP